MLTENSKYIIKLILGLREQSKVTGVVTTRTQSKLLASLSDEQLPLVCYELSRLSDPLSVGAR